MNFRHILIAVVLLVSAALAIDAATSTKPSAESPPGVITLFGPPSSKAEQKLQTVLKEVKFDQVALEEALYWIRDEAGLNLVINWKAMDAAGVDRKEALTIHLNDVTAAEALNVICREASEPTAALGFTADGNLVWFSAAEDVDRNVTRIYDIADLIIHEHARSEAISRPDATVQWSSDEIVEMVVRAIMETIAEETWRDNGGFSSIRELNGRLIITQSPENHQKVAELLNALRSAGVPTPARPKARPASRPAQSSTGSGLFSR